MEEEYTLPEYVFKIETTSGPEAESGENPVPEVRDWIDFIYGDEYQEPIPGQAFEIVKSDDSRVDKVTSDEEGVIRIEGLEFGDYHIKIKKEEGESESGAE